MTATQKSGPLGLVTALQQEFKTARKCLGPDTASFALIQSGVGRAAGYIAAEALGTRNGGVSGLVSLGFCGGLDPALACGSIIIPRHVITGDDQEWFSADEHWHREMITRLCNLGSCSSQSLFSARDVVETVADKAAIYENCKACAVDMESAGIAHAAQRLEVPFLAVRIVLDEAPDCLPRATANAVRPDGNLDLKGLLGGLARHPGDVAALIKLVRKSSRAQKQLKAVCDALKPSFALTSH